MNRKTVMLMGAAAALATGPALAAPVEPAVPAAATYSDLLQPIPNAVERLKIADMREDQATPAPGLIEAQYYVHHHHHHHHHRRRYRHHHHHHHHHNSYPPHY
ncbi:MAG TPA: hypothetical protein VGF71_06865 [Caulobacteraceae bacterium]|jgi:hypothetical protein